MTLIPLRMGPLGADGFAIHRSGIRWLRDDGHLCRPNEVVAYCNFTLERTTGRGGGPHPFAREEQLQIAFAPRLAGRLRRVERLSLGGYLDHHVVTAWDCDALLCHLEIEDTVLDSDLREGPDTARLMLLAGRRMTGLADVHGGLLPGWHNRSRAWWSDGQPGALPTLLSLGICDVTGVVVGDQHACIDMFEASAADAQIAFVPDHPLVPCAPFLLDQFTRSASQFQAIAADLRRGLAESDTVPTSDDWIFAGIFLSGLEHCALREGFDLLTPSGFRQQGAADTVLLSLRSESASILRHKKLGYRVQMLRHRLAAAGPAMKAWIKTAFEPVTRTVDDIKRDYHALIDAVRPATGARFIILNRMSTSGSEDVASYAQFDAPLGDTLSNIASKELNLMVEDLSAERAVAILDVDALAAEIGGADHIPDGIHQSGELQAMLRHEIMRLMSSGARLAA